MTLGRSNCHEREPARCPVPLQPLHLQPLPMRRASQRAEHATERRLPVPCIVRLRQRLPLRCHTLTGSAVARDRPEGPAATAAGTIFPTEVRTSCASSDFRPGTAPSLGSSNASPSGKQHCEPHNALFGRPGESASFAGDVPRLCKQMIHEGWLRSDNEFGTMLSESPETGAAALAHYCNLLTLPEGPVITLQEFAEQVIQAEEVDASEVDAMLLKPGELAAFTPRAID